MFSFDYHKKSNFLLNMKKNIYTLVLMVPLICSAQSDWTNIAAGADASASSQNNSNQGADKAVDAGYASSNRWVSSNTNQVHYLTLDLGQISTIEAYRIYLNASKYPTIYTLSYSSDSTSWDTLSTVDTTPEAATLSSTSMQLYQDTLSTALDSVRYFKFSADAADIINNGGEFFLRFHELELYGPCAACPDSITNFVVAFDTSDVENPQIDLSWDDNETDETEFKVSISGAALNTEIVSLAANTTSYSFDAFYGVNYNVSIEVVNASGSGVSPGNAAYMAHPRNIALNKVATGSSRFDALRDADGAVDGQLNVNEATRWVTSQTSASTGSPQWIEIDLASIHTVDGYRMANEDNSFGQPTSWAFQYWDGSDWVNADTLSSAPSPTDTVFNSSNTHTIHLYKRTFSSVSTSKVRLIINANATRARVYELEVYGDEVIKTWNGTAWSPSAPDSLESIVIDGNYNTTTNGNISNVYDITVNSGDTLIISNGGFVQNTGDFTNNGQVDIISGGALNTNGDGDITGDGFMIRRGTRHGESAGKYIVVGAPVANATFSRLGPGSINYAYDESKPYESSMDAGSEANDGLNRFISRSSTDTMLLGRGYFSAFTKAMIFEGTPNDGDVTVSLNRTEHDSSGSMHENTYEGFNLVANPYPCAISFFSFINGNLDNISGPIYLWDDFGSKNGRGSNSDYITVNAVGTTGTSRAGNQGNWDNFLRSGQGFFIQLDSGKTSIGFADSMRVTGNNGDGAFFRSIDDISSLKFVLTDHQEDIYSESLIGFVNGATKGVDKLYDASVFSNGGTKLFSLIDNKQYAIQGLPSLGEEASFTLGLMSKQAGELTISIANLKNISSEYAVLLKDNETGLSVNLSEEEDYKFITEEGVDNNRFDVTITSNISSVQSVNSSANGDFYYQLNQQSLLLGMKGVKEVSANVEISDMEPIQKFVFGHHSKKIEVKFLIYTAHQM